MPTLSVIVPVYLNAESLPALEAALTALEQALSDDGIDMQIIYVDDASTDGSLNILKNMQIRRPSTVLLHHVANQGSMEAIKTGLRHAKGDCFTYLAADLQDPPELIREMAQAWQAGEKFVVRTRATREDPLPSKLFAWINYKLVRLLVLPDYPEGGFDMCVMDKVMLPHLLRCGRNKNLAMSAWTLGIPPKIMTYHRRARAHGKSQWTFSKKFVYFVDSTIGFSVKPMRIASAAGLIIAIGCFAYTAVVITGRALGLIPVAGFATLAAMLGFLQGCVLIFMGLLGEYVWRIYMELDRNAQPVVERVEIGNAQQPDSR
jgi:glycosyltransferase involved in cell wall biosynthesis